MQTRSRNIAWPLALLATTACSGDAATPDPGSTGDEPVVSRFEVSPQEGFGAEGGDALLSWSVTDADRIRIEPGVGEVQGDQTTVSVTESTIFTLTATNDAGSSEAQAVALVATAENSDFDLTAQSATHQIDDALGRGEIDDATALQYKVFALHDDPRLPPRFDADGPMHGTEILLELRDRFDQLPAAVQAEMQPFLLPLEDPASWYSIRSTTASKGGEEDMFALPPLEGDRLVAGGRIRVRWQSSLNDFEKGLANTVVVAVLERSYAELTDLMGREPLGDGVDPNIYPVYVIGVGNRMGWVTPGEQTENGIPSHMVIDLRRILNRATNTDEIEALPSDVIAFTVAHEMLHSIGAVFGLDEPFSNEARWLHESSATWAANYVYPSLDWEHRYVGDFLRRTDLAMDDFSEPFSPYGSYLFHLMASELDGPERIRQFWEESEDRPVWTAIDRALGGELPNRYADFAAVNWNAGPVRQHLEWDNLEQGVATSTDAFETVEVTLDGAAIATIPLAIETPGVRGLTAKYFHLKFEDPDVRTLLFANGVNYELGREVPSDLIVEHDGDSFFVVNEVFTEVRARDTPTRLLVKSEGVWSGPYDLTLVPFVAFCQDLPEERVEELVFVFANGNFAPGDRAAVEPRGLQATILASNMACGAWTGTGTGISTTTPAPGTVDFSLLETNEVMLRDLLFTRTPSPISELVKGADSTNLGRYLYTGFFPTYQFSLADAAIDWTVNYDSTSGTQSCGGGGQLSLDETQAFGSLFTFNHSLPNDPNYRGHYIYVDPAVELEYEVECTESEGGTNSESFSLSFDSADEPISVAPDGSSISARTESTDVGGVSQNTEVWTWELLSR